MQERSHTIKYEYFRQKGNWDSLARDVCSWVNINLNVVKIVGITSVLCHFDNAKMINLFYNDGPISEDILKQASHLILCYEIVIQARKMQHSWRVHNEKMMVRLNQLSKDRQIVAINSLEDDQSHEYNLTIIWYKRSK